MCWPINRHPRRTTSGTWTVRKVNADNAPEWDVTTSSNTRIYGVHNGKCWIAGGGQARGYDVNDGSVTTIATSNAKLWLPGGAGVLHEATAFGTRLTMTDLSGSTAWTTPTPGFAASARWRIHRDKIWIDYHTASGPQARRNGYIAGAVSGSLISADIPLHPANPALTTQLNSNGCSFIISDERVATVNDSVSFSVFDLTGADAQVVVGVNITYRPSGALWVGAMDGLCVARQNSGGVSYVYLAEYNDNGSLNPGSPYVTDTLPAGEVIQSLGFNPLYGLYYMVVSVTGGYEIRHYDTSWSLIETSHLISGLPALPFGFAENNLTTNDVCISHESQGIKYYKRSDRLYDYDGNSIGNTQYDSVTPYDRIHAALFDGSLYQNGQGGYL